MIELLAYFFICTTAILAYSTYNTLKKIEHLEEIVEEQDIEYFNMKGKIRETIKGMRDIDTRQAFEKEDEVGQTFKSLLSLVEDLGVEDEN